MIDMNDADQEAVAVTKMRYNCADKHMDTTYGYCTICREKKTVIKKS